MDPQNTFKHKMTGYGLIKKEVEELKGKPYAVDKEEGLIVDEHRICGNLCGDLWRRVQRLKKTWLPREELEKEKRGMSKQATYFTGLHRVKPFDYVL